MRKNAGIQSVRSFNLHDSQIRPKSFFAFVQQGVLDFWLQNGFFEKSLKPGCVIQDL
ncbi:MAG: hypothetical protein J7M27_02070 [Candidatus Latescibacteria bacterium]|nr:hypothetical protein [Candidatus Latescibacterota bacterium]